MGLRIPLYLHISEATDLTCSVLLHRSKKSLYLHENGALMEEVSFRTLPITSLAKHFLLTLTSPSLTENGTFCVFHNSSACQT